MKKHKKDKHNTDSEAVEEEPPSDAVEEEPPSEAVEEEPPSSTPKMGAIALSVLKAPVICQHGFTLAGGKCRKRLTGS